MVAFRPQDEPDRVVIVDHGVGGLVRVAAIYGANASGKSNLLKGFSFFQSAIRDSQRRWEHDQLIPVQQFALGDLDHGPTKMSLDFLLQGVRFQYGFTLRHDRFLSEWLHAYPNGRKQIWFERADGCDIRFGNQMSGSKTGVSNRTIESLVRPNSLLLSTAVQNNYEKLTPIYDYIVKNWIEILGGGTQLATSTAQRSLHNSALKQKLSRLLLAADLGIVDYEVLEEDLDESTQKVIHAMFSAMPESSRASFPEVPMKVSSLQFAHARNFGTPVRFSSAEESSGTIAYFGILGPICEVLEKGGFIYIDEIETSLHPNLAKTIINLFANSRTNLKNAQLLFTTHQISLLGEATMRRDEVWLTEKSRDGSTSLFPLTDFHIRKDEKIDKGYAQGRFGGVPNIDSDQIDMTFAQGGLGGEAE